MASFTCLVLGQLSAGAMEMTGVRCFSSFSRLIHMVVAGYRDNRIMQGFLKPGFGIGKLSPQNILLDNTNIKVEK